MRLQVESHLSDCDECRKVLAAVMDGGAEPEWLSVCRQMDRTLKYSSETTLSIAYESTPESASKAKDRIAQSLSMPTEERYRLVRICGEGGMGKDWSDGTA